MKLQSCTRACAGLLLLLTEPQMGVSAVRIASEENATVAKQVERVARAVVKKFGLLDIGTAEAEASASSTSLMMWIDYLLFPFKTTSLPKVSACVAVWICLKMFILCSRNMAEDLDGTFGSQIASDCGIAKPVKCATANEDESSESESEDDVCLASQDKADDVTKVDRFFDDHWEDLVQRISGTVRICKRQGFFRIEALAGPVVQERFLAISAMSGRNLRSSLAWWADIEAHSSGKQPLDRILLQQISSVREEHGTHGAPAVVVWYWREEENTRLNILFSSVEAAEAFSRSLTELLTRLIRRNRLAARKK